MSDNIIIEAQGLVKRYGDPSAGSGRGVEAVRGLSFAIRRGEIFGFLGPNGAGKTTTISMLSCLLEPTEGTAIVAGYDVVKAPGEVKRRIGLVPQELALYPTLSARDNLNFYGRIYGLRGRTLRRRVDEVLGMVGLAERAGSAVEDFSGGMKRRLNIAAGLLHRPEVLFLDEPTVGVDPQSRNGIFEHVERLNADGMTILYTTHYMEEAERLCHRVAIIDQGRIIALDTPRKLIADLGGGIIHLGVANGMAEGLLEQMRALPEVRAVTQFDGKVKVEATRAQEALVGLLALFNRTDTDITSLEVLEPNLETVFLQLTGKRLRD
ncbi:MAG: export ABC transporter ATP-binding protein [Chloroflexota bacterium]|nr:MAG: export ABC transporter ATP-binding protein [Chloroflexota bacterium]